MLTFLHSLLIASLLLADDAAIKEFNDHVQRYADLHKQIESSLPPVNKKKEPDPAAIVGHQKALAKGIREARPKAAEGDLFTPPVRKIFVELINQELTSWKGTTARGMILGEGNPKNPESQRESPAAIDLRVNAEYPAKAALSTVPPSVLLSLPKLPDGLQYRFVGRDLILYDAPANLIVDILKSAIR